MAESKPCKEIAGASLQLTLIPLVLIIEGKMSDKLIGFKALFPFPAALFLLLFCLIIGVPWLVISIYWQHRYGKDTLLETGPYYYCRHPMNFGTIGWFLGWAAFANSPTALFGVFVFILIVFFYNRSTEEPQLQKKFGVQYENYKKSTPFLIPSLKKLLKPYAFFSK